MIDNNISRKYIPYWQMDDYVKNHQENSASNVFQLAAYYFRENSFLCEYYEPFSYGQDVILMDDDFIQISKVFPVNIVNSVQGSILSSRALFPPNYDCYVIRHLNSLKIDWHAHDFYEICYVWSGTCCQRIKAETYQLNEGDFLIIPTDTLHIVENVGKDSVIFNIMVRKQALRTSSMVLTAGSNAIASFFRHSLISEDSKICLPVHTDNSMYLKRIIKHLCQECYIMPEVFCDFAADVFNQLLCSLMLDGEVKTENMRLPENISLIGILKYIQQNYSSITLKQLSKQYNFSEEYLSRLIRKHTGNTFSQLVTEIRMEQAKRLLNRTAETIENIGINVGYQDCSTFVRAFKKYARQTPTAYRKQTTE